MDKRIFAMAIISFLALAAEAVAQPAAQKSDKMAMPGMTDPGSSTNMQTLMKRCAAMQTQMQKGAPMTPDQTQLMRQCAGMEAKMRTQAPPDTLSR